MDPNDFTYESYFAQCEYYFSESSGQFIPFDDLPFQHTYYAFRKLVRERIEGFANSVLYDQFVATLQPTPADIRFQLRKYGRACHMFVGSEKHIRAKVYAAAKRGGIKVTTHMHTVERNSGWIEASNVVGPIRVKGKS